MIGNIIKIESIRKEVVKVSPEDIKALSFLIHQNLKFEEDDMFFMNFFCKESRAAEEPQKEEDR